jgi:SAM-dependent methyltransferase
MAVKMNEKLVFDLAAVSIGTRLRNREVLRRWQIRPKHVFDFGCGVGVFTRDLMRLGISSIGMEYDYQKAHVGYKKLKSPFITGDITRLPLKNGSVEVALVRDVLEHLYDDNKAILEVKRVLRTGGFLIITVPNYNWGPFYKLGKIKSEDHGHLRLYNKKNLIEQLTDINFTIEQIEQFQNPLATLLEFMLIKAELRMYGKENVQQSKMSQLASGKFMLSMFYILISKIIWPLIVIAEYVSPDKAGSEILIVVRKSS